MPVTSEPKFPKHILKHFKLGSFGFYSNWASRVNPGKLGPTFTGLLKTTFEDGNRESLSVGLLLSPLQCIACSGETWRKVANGVSMQRKVSNGVPHYHGARFAWNPHLWACHQICMLTCHQHLLPETASRVGAVTGGGQQVLHRENLQTSGLF